jgi:hypothetical protein
MIPAQPVTAGAEAGSRWVKAREREKALNVSGPEGIPRRMEVRMLGEHQQFLAEYGGQTVCDAEDVPWGTDAIHRRYACGSAALTSPSGSSGHTTDRSRANHV